MVEKDQKLSWRDLWEVDVAEVMREETIAHDTDRAINGWLPKWRRVEGRSRMSVSKGGL
jgi:hypothetical protein